MTRLRPGNRVAASWLPHTTKRVRTRRFGLVQTALALVE